VGDDTLDSKEDARMEDPGLSFPLPEIKTSRKPGAPFLYRPIGVWTVRIVTAALILGSWQLYAQHQSRALNAPPTEIAQRVWAQVHQHALWSAFWSSGEALVLGFLLALVIGIPVGIAMGRWRAVEHVLDPYVSFLYALPHVVFVPVMVVWFGFELKFRLLYVLVSAVWPFIINVMVGVRNVDPELLAAAKSYCATERQTVRTVVLPGIAPYVVAASRQAFALSWIAVVVSEVLSTQTGLGGLLTQYTQNFQTADSFVPILLICAVAVIIQSGTAFLQKVFTPWSNSQQQR
jgi:ABC-type nitrate/sulfonate/bicarbonate transport system permease component